MSPIRPRRLAYLAALATAAVSLAVLAPVPAAAQLLSPGKLSSSHAKLEGMANCTTCHELGKRSVPDAKCLGCHKLLAGRMEAKRGYHATFAGKRCVECHKEHFGVDFALVRMDTAGFDHATTGFGLRLAHRKITCRDCHKPDRVTAADVRQYATENQALDRTYFGLGTSCLDCHRTEDVHAGQFGSRGCPECHDEATWKDAPRFNHDSTRYALTGKHRTTECSGCHKAIPVGAGGGAVVRFAGVTFAACSDCHRDPHKGSMRRACTDCHTTEDWNRLLNRSTFETTFDHVRTRFPLRGAHAKAPCVRCHDRGAARPATLVLTFPAGAPGTLYPAPAAQACTSCHTDYHRGVFARSPGGVACTGCHTEAAWLPTTFDLARHNQQTWKLTGAHVAVPCIGCHAPAGPARGQPQFRVNAQECTACHAADDPHAGQFAQRKCDECHTTAVFRVPQFDHSRARYQLDGAHQKVPCAGCHATVTPTGGKPYVRYRPLVFNTCRACHGAAMEGNP